MNNMKSIIKEIRHGYEQLKKNQTDAVKDNFHLLFSVYAFLMTSLKKEPLPGDDKAPAVFEYAAGFCKLTKNTLDRAGFDSFLSGLSGNVELNSEEISVLPDMFFAALFLSVCRNCRRENGRERVLSAVKSMRFLKSYGDEDLYEKLSPCEKLFCRDAVYKGLDRESKNLYRRKLFLLSKKENISEQELLRGFFEQAKSATKKNEQSIGFYLFREKHSSLYMPLTIILPVMLCIITAILCKNAWAAFLTLLPWAEGVKVLVEFVYAHIVHPEPLLRMNTENGVEKTLTAHITLLSDKKSADASLLAIETVFYANKTPNMFFGILADLPVSLENITNEELQVIAYLKSGIAALNKKHSGAFFVAVRKRTKNSENRFCGRERKRGAVEDFLNAVKGRGEECFLLLDGDIGGAKYFCALDSDTEPQPDSVRRLVGILEYPPYSPVLSPDGKSVKSGYAIASPRLEVLLSSARENLFSKIISGFGGIEMYSNPSFSVYQDLYGEGIFAGKGVIDIDCFLSVIGGALPENTVLSHDILEGSLLRTAYASDVVFADNTPKNLLSYCSRAHRWVRGDCQNIIFIKKPFSALSRYKLADNLRRALNPIALLLLIVSSVLFGFWPAALALAVMFLPAVLSVVKSLFDGSIFHGVFFRTGAFPSIFYTLFQPLFRLMYLPMFAWTHLNAAVKAFYRLCVKKRLLEWTTAAQADKKIKGKLLEYLVKMPSQLIGLVFLFYMPMIWLTVLWITAIFLAYFSASEKKKKKPAFDTLPYVRDMWRYFADFQTAKNNFLPPDNFQQQPLGVEARRTSPTNIGLSLLCALGAYDMEIIDENTLYTFLENSLTSIEKLEKYKGQLFNWYSTKTTEPLLPRYVSSVDNGNYAAFMYALKNGLEAFSARRAQNIVFRIEKLLSETDFSMLYDKKKELFYIGFNADTGEFSSSYYDLYASESRLLSYYAIANRHVSQKNWQTLSRFLFRKNGRLGMKSWTGTMFEYFMPHILLPVPDGSLCDEVLLFAIEGQIKAGTNGMWGISESAYYSFDSSLSYRYKAFGAPLLALKESTGYGTVLSPYSTWLTLPFFPEKAIANLERLKNAGMYGKYGFYEALDMSVSPPCVVTQFMVHHVGMSLLSAVNFSKNNIMQKRFMSAKMQAYSGLLQEKLTPVIFNYQGQTEGKHRKERYFSKGGEYSDIRPDYPNALTLSNTMLTQTLCDSGQTELSFEGKDVFRVGENSGQFFLCRCENLLLPMTYLPLCDSGTSYRVFFDEGGAFFYSQKKELEGRVHVLTDPEENCTVWQATVKNNSQKKHMAELLYYAEPTLSERLSAQAHPAFSALFIESFFEDGVLYFHRRVRAEESESLWLAVAADASFEYELSRFFVLDKGGLSTLASAFTKSFSNDCRGAVDPCCALRFSSELFSHETVSVTVFSAVGKTLAAAKTALENTRKKGVENIFSAMSAAAFSRYDASNIKTDETRIFNIIRSSLLQRHSLYRPREYRNTSSIENLWKYGISGDFPIILIKLDEMCVDECEAFMKAFYLFRVYKINCEAVFCFSENPGYDRPLHTRLRELLFKNGLEPCYEKRCGVFLVNLSSLGDFSLLATVCSFYADLTKGWRVRRPSLPYSNPAVISESKPTAASYSLKTGIGGFTDSGYAIDDKSLFPNRPPWTHILCNRSFGTIVSESTLGFSYAFNSQKNPLTPWQNDAVTDNTGEKLLLSVGKNTFDVLSGATAFFEKGFARYKAVCNNVKVSVCVFVPVWHKVKIIECTVENGEPESVSLVYRPEIVMGKRPSAINKTSDSNAVYFTNPLNRAYPDAVSVLFGCNTRISGDSLVFVCASGLQRECCFLLGCEGSLLRAKALVSAFNADKVAHEKSRLISFFKHENTVEIKTDNPELDAFFNRFLLYQIKTSRLTARAAFYQCGGGFGFRDQLQDAASIVTVDSLPLRHQILRACRHQFLQGDVMHWWHESAYGMPDEGIRTRSSDDFLWLVFAVCEYCEKTGDTAFLNRSVEYLVAPELEKNESERLMLAQKSKEKESVYMHCVRALGKSGKTGEHGLLLFEGGDWNDGMTAVGGESVWTTMFYIWLCERFSKIAETLGDSDFAALCKSRADALRHATEQTAYEKDRYIRAFFANGKKLGSSDSAECSVDILPQAFAAISGFDRQRTATALETANRLLFDRENKLVKLFWPPLKEINAGYISGYIGGVRENGGQYSHAAVWLSLAFFESGRYEKAYELLCALNPVTHSKSLSAVQQYRVEPYVLSADVYSNPAHVGMGGWSWYTGAAGWYFKVLTERLLGLDRRKNKLYVRPCLPESIDGYSARLRVEGADIELTVRKNSYSELTVDGERAEFIPIDGKSHKADYLSEYLLS